MCLYNYVSIYVTRGPVDNARVSKPWGSKVDPAQVEEFSVYGWSTPGRWALLGRWLGWDIVCPSHFESHRPLKYLDSLDWLTDFGRLLISGKWPCFWYGNTYACYKSSFTASWSLITFNNVIILEYLLYLLCVYIIM